MSRYPETRNSDLELQARLLENFYPPFEQPVYNWRQVASVMQAVPTLDHIARARRKVIQDYRYSKYLPTDEAVAKARKINEDVWHSYMTGMRYPQGENFHASIEQFDDATIYGRDI